MDSPVGIFMNEEIEVAAENELTTVVTARARALEAYFSSIEEDLVSLAVSPMTQDGLPEFEAAWNAIEGSDPTEVLQAAYITDNPNPTGSKKIWTGSGTAGLSRRARRVSQRVPHIPENEGYYDIFLFDLDGNLLYTVFKELDYATNLENGPYAGSGLGDAFRAAKASPSAVSFIDFAPYEPSFGAPASFISTGVRGQGGTTLGVLVFQMPIDRINQVMQSDAGLHNSFDAVIVGADNLRRSDSRFASESAILKETVDWPGVDEAIGGNTGFKFAEVEGVEKALGYAPFSFHGSTWAVLATVDKAEMFAKGRELTLVMLGLSVALLIGAMVIGLVFSRNITKPLGNLIDATRLVAGGNYDIEVPSRDRKDEIGDLAAALERFRETGVETERLRGEQESDRRQAEDARIASLRRMADDVEAMAGQAVDGLSQRTGELASRIRVYGGLGASGSRHISGRGSCRSRSARQRRGGVCRVRRTRCINPGDQWPNG